jgi:hypothetical protein
MWFERGFEAGSPEGGRASQSIPMAAGVRGMVPREVNVGPVELAVKGGSGRAGVWSPQGAVCYQRFWMFAMNA